MRNNNCFFTSSLQNIFFYVQHKKETHTVSEVDKMLILGWTIPLRTVHWKALWDPKIVILWHCCKKTFLEPLFVRVVQITHYCLNWFCILLKLYTCIMICIYTILMVINEASMIINLTSQASLSGLLTSYVLKNPKVFHLSSLSNQFKVRVHQEMKL